MKILIGATALVLLIARINCQGQQQLDCFGDFFTNPDNGAALAQISSDCGGLAVELVRIRITLCVIVNNYVALLLL